MSGQHTQGRIIHIPAVGRAGDYLEDESGTTVCDFYFLSSRRNDFPNAAANARRLAAAWNHIIELDTETVEAMPAAVEFLKAQSDALSEMAVDRDNALRELTTARSLLREVAKSIQEHDGGGIFDHEKNRIRSYLGATDNLGGEG